MMPVMLQQARRAFEALKASEPLAHSPREVSRH